MQQELADRLGVFDQTVTADATKLKRWLNMAQQYICGKRLWPFMLSEEVIQTVADYTTGTVTTVAGSTTVTFSGTISTSKTNFYFQSSSSTDWYQVTAHTAGALTATISPAATTSGSALTFTIRKLLYTTTTPLMQILDMKQFITPVRMVPVSPLVGDYFLPLYYSQGVPYYYIMSSPNSSGTPQFSFLQSPSSVLNIFIRGIKALTDMSSDTDTSVIPVPWHDALISIAAYYGYLSLDDDRANNELIVGEKRIEDMKTILSHDLGRHRVMQTVDNDSNYGLTWNLPADFGPPVA